MYKLRSRKFQPKAEEKEEIEENVRDEEEELNDEHDSDEEDMEVDVEDADIGVAEEEIEIEMKEMNTNMESPESRDTSYSSSKDSFVRGATNETAVENFRKKKRCSRFFFKISLTSDIYRVLVDFLQELEEDPSDKKPLSSWCIKLREAGARGPHKSAKKALHECAERLGVKTFAGRLYIYFKNSGKLVAPKDEMQKVIMDAHKGIGMFAEDRQKESSAKSTHNNVAKTFFLIQRIFTVGQRSFGFSRLSVYQEVLHCRGCYTGDKGVNFENSFIKKLERSDPDFGNELNFVSLKDAPLSMAVSGPSKSSVWFNQQGLADEKMLYMKLLGVITEIGIEVQKAIQGDPVAKERLLTKICCGEKLIFDMKANRKQSLENSCLKMSQFMDSYLEMEKLYREIGRLDLYVYDMNLLLFLYKFNNPEFLMDKINSCIQALRDGKKYNLKFIVSNQEKTRGT